MKVISIVAMAAGLVLAVNACSKVDPAKPDPAPTSTTLKIMSFNVRSSTMNDEGDRNWSSRKTGVKQMIEDQLPDVVGMQEATTAQRNDLKSLLPGYELLEVPGTGTSKGGNTIILYNKSTVKLNSCKSFYLSKTPNTPSVNGWNDETQYRTTIWGEFSVIDGGKKFFVADTHMPLNTGGASKGQTARTNSAALNVERLKAAAGEDGVLFILGDMNCETAGEGLQPYYDWMSGAREKALVTDKVKSYNNWGGSGQKILDHIFYRNAIATEFKTITGKYTVSYVSDHYPVMAKFTVL